MHKEVNEGKSLSDSLTSRHALFPSLVVGMVGTGEKTGNLPEMLSNMGKYFLKESDEKIKTFTTAFEPTIILVMGKVSLF